VAQVAEHLPSKLEASFQFSVQQKKKKEGKCSYHQKRK
jgi:hypothetical protein